MASMTTAFIVTATTASLIAGLTIWRYNDRRYDAKVWTQLLADVLRAQTEAEATLFDLTMIEDLPDPAKRFFAFAIAPGTRLHKVCEISMGGKFSLGDKENPNYFDMSAEQVLAAPRGFVWKMQAGSSIGGSDGACGQESWTRFWLYNLVPVARAGNNQDHARSAFGRYASEALLWCPAAALPQPGVVRWESVNDNTARMLMTQGNMSQSVDLTVDKEGKLQKIMFPRWTNANAEKIFRLQPFRGFASEFSEFDGYHLPTRVEAGSNFGTEPYHPFSLPM